MSAIAAPVSTNGAELEATGEDSGWSRAEGVRPGGPFSITGSPASTWPQSRTRTAQTRMR